MTITERLLQRDRDEVIAIERKRAAEELAKAIAAEREKAAEEREKAVAKERENNALETIKRILTGGLSLEQIINFLPFLKPSEIEAIVAKLSAQ